MTLWYSCTKTSSRKIVFIVEYIEVEVYIEHIEYIEYIEVERIQYKNSLISSQGKRDNNTHQPERMGKRTLTLLIWLTHVFVSLQIRNKRNESFKQELKKH